MTRRLSNSDRFFAKVDKTATCWNWTAKKIHTGYGQFWINGGHTVAHRIAYEWLVGPIPEGMEIDHTCHNRSCVNPAHMRVVTHKQNQENNAGAYHNSSSGVRGVIRVSSRNHWRTEVVHNKKTYSAGTFQDVESAAVAVKALRLELFTHNDLDRVA